MTRTNPPVAELTAAQLDALEARVRGPVLRPAGAGYDAERAGFQTAGQHRPSVIVGAAGVADVRAAVELARDHGLPVAVQATGHGLSAAARGGVLISTRRMDGVDVDGAARTARIAAGARWERVIQAVAPHGLAPLNGSAPHVGAAGYTLAGGLPLLARRYGYAADHVRSIEVVTADARIRRVTADEEPDLFWALRGGQGNFGVVTSLEIDLVPVARVYGGGLFFDGGRVAEVLHAWLRWTATVPDEMTSSVALVPLPDLPIVPEPIRGRYIVHVRIVYAGGAADGERLVAPLRAIGPRLIDALRDLPYAESGSIYNDPAHPHAYRGTNALLRELPEGAVQAVLGLTGPGAPVTCVVQVNHLGGALARPPAVASSVGHRDARYLLRVLSPLGAAGAEAVTPVHDGVLRALAPWTAGRAVGFLFGESTVEQVRGAYEPDAYRRLTGLKAIYDRDNTFRLNHNIPPRS